jgi:hypothetical protein
VAASGHGLVTAPARIGVGQAGDGGRRHTDRVEGGTEDADGAEAGGKASGSGRQAGFGAWTVVGQTAAAVQREVAVWWAVAWRVVVAAAFRSL